MPTVHFIALNGTKQSRTFKTKKSAELFERRLMRGQRVAGTDAAKVKCTACARAKARAKRRSERRGRLLRALHHHLQSRAR